METFNNIVTVSVYNQSNVHFMQRNLNIIEPHYEIDENNIKTDIQPFDLKINIEGLECSDLTFTQSVWNVTIKDYIHETLNCEKTGDISQHSIPI